MQALDLRTSVTPCLELKNFNFERGEDRAALLSHIPFFRSRLESAYKVSDLMEAAAENANKKLLGTGIDVFRTTVHAEKEQEGSLTFLASERTFTFKFNPSGDPDSKFFIVQRTDWERLNLLIVNLSKDLGIDLNKEFHDIPKADFRFDSKQVALAKEELVGVSYELVMPGKACFSSANAKKLSSALTDIIEQALPQLRLIGQEVLELNSEAQDLKMRIQGGNLAAAA